METPPILRSRPRRQSRAWLTFLTLSFLLTGASSRAAMQFDTYLGLDSYVPEASWFPLICEVYNDGPAFNGTIEVTTGMGQSGYPRLVPIELPTGTRKRVSIPLFCSSSYNGEWNAVLRDEDGRVRAERANLRPQRIVSRGATLMGALGRQSAWAPALKAPLSRNTYSNRQRRACCRH